MRWIEAPTIYSGTAPSLFLAGGISGCPDWQAEMADLLAGSGLVLLNPRRTEFPMHDPAAAAAQIQWEYDHLRRATAVSFWFPCETLCPITLYELGAWAMTDKPLFIGVHPAYARRQDIHIQIALARPDAPIVHSLADLVQQIRTWHGQPQNPIFAQSDSCRR